VAVTRTVQIDAAYWLYVPLGKLRTDRYIPLYPQLKHLLDDWGVDRPLVPLSAASLTVAGWSSSGHRWRHAALAIDAAHDAV